MRIHIGRKAPKGYRELPGSMHLGRGIWMLRVERVPLESDTGTAAKIGVEIKSSRITKLNQCVDDYDLTSNDTRRGD